MRGKRGAANILYVDTCFFIAAIITIGIRGGVLDMGLRMWEEGTL